MERTLAFCAQRPATVLTIRAFRTSVSFSPAISRRGPLVGRWSSELRVKNSLTNGLFIHPGRNKSEAVGTGPEPASQAESTYSYNGMAYPSACPQPGTRDTQPLCPSQGTPAWGKRGFVAVLQRI